MPETSRNSDLWRFMLRIYAAPGVAAACLRLQDRHHVDVPLFLASLYAVSIGMVVAEAEVRQLDGACAEWRRDVVRPLRDIRRQMKQRDWMQAAPPTAGFREQVKALELQAEQLQVSLLWQVITTLPRGKPANTAAFRHAATTVIGHFGAPPGPDAGDDIDVVVAALSATGRDEVRATGPAIS